MKYVFLFESYNKLGKKDKDLLERIYSHKESWRKILLEFENNKDKFERFMEHFNVLEFIKHEPDKMSALLAPIIRDSESLRKWISDNSEEMPEEFKKSAGLYSDLKDLGF